MTQWEYKEMYLGKISNEVAILDLEMVNILGEDGWELFQVNSNRCLFKRPIEEKEAPDLDRDKY